MAEAVFGFPPRRRRLQIALPVSAALFCFWMQLPFARGQRELDPRIADQAADMMVRADKLAAAGDQEEAVSRYTTLAQRYPGTEIAATALWQIYRLQLSRDNPEGAFEALDRLAAGQPGHFEKAQDAQLKLAVRLMGTLEGERRSLEKVHPVHQTKPEVIEAMLTRIIQLGPFSEAGIQAEHYLALAKERAGEEKEAAALHEQFLDRHPDHEMADDAAYQVAYIHYKRWKSMVGESPRYRETAAVALAYFLARYPDSAKAAQARSCLSDVRASEFKEMIALAEYYEKDDRPAAASVYYREIGEKFPEVVSRSPELQKKVRGSIQASSENAPPEKDAPVGPERSEAKP